MQLKVNTFRFRKKIAACDFDHTLICPTKDATFSKNVDDWEWLTPQVPDILKKYYQDGYCIMIFSNQMKKWKADQIQQCMLLLEIPVLINVGYADEDRKPNAAMFLNAVNNKAWDKKKSFYCGDALGRKEDWFDIPKESKDESFPRKMPGNN